MSGVYIALRIERIIAALLVFLAVLGSAGAIQNYYEFNMTYDYGTVSINSYSIKTALSEKDAKNIEGKWIAEVLNSNEKVIGKTYFSIPNEIIGDIINPDTGEIEGPIYQELNFTTFILKIPYDSRIKKIRIKVFDMEKYKMDTVAVLPIEKQLAAAALPEKTTEEQKMGRKTEVWLLLLFVVLVGLAVTVYAIRKLRRGD